MADNARCQGEESHDTPGPPAAPKERMEARTSGEPSTSGEASTVYPGLAESKAFVTGHTRHKRESIVKHGISKAHKRCETKLKGPQQGRSTIQAAFQRQGAAAQSQVEAELAIMFGTAYMVGKEELLFTKFKPLLQLQKKDGLSLNTTYGNDIACAKFLKIISDTFTENTADGTAAKGKDGRLPMLDVMMIRIPDNSITTDVFHKETHTNHYLLWSSNHPVHQKLGIVRTLMHRANTLIEDHTLRAAEKEKVRDALRHCGYPEWALKEGDNNLTNGKKRNKDRTSENKERHPASYAVLPYNKGVTERLKRAYSKHNPTLKAGHRVTNGPILDIVKIIDQESRKAHRNIKEAVHIQLERAGMNRNEGWELPKSYLPLLRKEAGQPRVLARLGHSVNKMYSRQRKFGGLFEATKAAFASLKLGEPCQNLLEKTIGMTADELALLAVQKNTPMVSTVYGILDMVYRTYHGSAKSRSELKKLGEELGVTHGSKPRALNALLKPGKKDGKDEELGQYTAVHIHMDHLTET
ncbi:hypothetical protein Bbelb_344340 [Branchiostoma belcheri]|nr:hypothetical protein Bbelb_344340 [Branchiostoma belcheri]